MNFSFTNVSHKARCVLATAVAAFAVIGASAQTTVSKTFKVCPLNVDGLPQKILTYEINADGPGSDGTKKIGQYIAQSGVDVFGLSEDFNYNGSLLEGAGDDYQAGTWRGSISLSSTGNLDFTNLRFLTDGLQFLVKKNNTFSDESWTAWAQNSGKFTNGCDELITKGYRYYKVNLGQGINVEFYIMHMDAETDSLSNAARASQWEQLCQAIIENNSGLPKIVMGDTNSRYTRDDILGLFINPITADGHYTVNDVWVEKCKNGVYPTLGDDALVVPEADRTKSSAYPDNEIVDKVLYLNPTSGGIALTPDTIVFDADNYQENGKLLGDHVPVVVTFKAQGTIYVPAASTGFWKGEAFVGNDQAAYIYNVGSQYFVSNDNTPSVTDITQAPIWHIYGTDKYTISNDEGYRLQMTKKSQGVVSGSGATTFSNHENGTTEGSVRIGLKDWKTFFDSKTHFFTIAYEDDKYTYTAATTKDTGNDWLLISETQKQAYLRYVALYNKANSLLGERDDLNDELVSVLKSTQSTTYSTVASDTTSLRDIIAKYESQSFDVTIPSTQYTTTCLPWNASVPDGVKVYIATAYNTDATPSKVHLKQYSADVLPKGVGFVLYADEAGTYTFTRSQSAAETPSDNILSGTCKQQNAADLDFASNNYMLLDDKTDGVAFYTLASDSFIPAYSAYILRSYDANDNVAKLEFDTPTGISTPQSAADATPTAFYGIAGDKRNHMVRGINIVRMSDGTVRKVIVK